jgi:hypothetical protein
MSGNIYGQDQIRKINAAYPGLVAHLRSLLAADHTGVGLMRVHVQVESFDSDEMAAIFRSLSFISPIEKKALVRAAIYQLMAQEPALFVAPASPTFETAPLFLHANGDFPSDKKVFTPPAFRLNVNQSAEFHGQSPADTPAPAPVVTSTHTPIVQPKVQASVDKLKLASAPKEIQIPLVPEDVNLQDLSLADEE